jgi:predicted metal-dependent hydrolase
VRVTVEPDGAVVVTLPARAVERDAAAAVAELRGWIDRRRREAAARAVRLARPEGTVPYLGELLELVPSGAHARAPARGRLHVPAAEPARREASSAGTGARARRGRAPARRGPPPRSAAPYTRLSIREQRTRWGSCSAKGAMSFNWRLLLAPPEILDYVVWHEACHLVHLDHSPRFWAELARHRPGYREPQRWLRRNGGALHL